LRQERAKVRAQMERLMADEPAPDSTSLEAVARRCESLRPAVEITRCPACDEPCHATESDEAGLCEGCREARDLYEGASAAARRAGVMTPDEPGEVTW
jgi:hypothetical protein